MRLKGIYQKSHLKGHPSFGLDVYIFHIWITLGNILHQCQFNQLMTLIWITGCGRAGARGGEVWPDTRSRSFKWSALILTRIHLGILYKYLGKIILSYKNNYFAPGPSNPWVGTELRYITNFFFKYHCNIKGLWAFFQINYLSIYFGFFLYQIRYCSSL